MSQSYEYSSAYRTGALTIRWERLITGADVIGGTGSDTCG